MDYTDKEIMDCHSVYEDLILAGCAQKPKLLLDFPLGNDDFTVYKVYFIALKSLLSEGFQVMSGGCKQRSCATWNKPYALLWG